MSLISLPQTLSERSNPHMSVPDPAKMEEDITICYNRRKKGVVECRMLGDDSERARLVLLTCKLHPMNSPYLVTGSGVVKFMIE